MWKLLSLTAIPVLVSNPSVVEVEITNATAINPVEYCPTFHYMHLTRASAWILQMLHAAAF